MGSVRECGGGRRSLGNGFPTRKLNPDVFQCFEILHDCFVGYHPSSGPNFTVRDDAQTWVISSGTGIFIHTNAINQWALAFCCVSNKKATKCHRGDIGRPLYCIFLRFGASIFFVFVVSCSVFARCCVTRAFFLNKLVVTCFHPCVPLCTTVY